MLHRRLSQGKLLHSALNPNESNLVLKRIMCVASLHTIDTCLAEPLGKIILWGH